MAKINWTYEAEYWLKDIYDYIAADNPTAAAYVVREIYDKDTGSCSVILRSGTDTTNR